MTSTPPTTLQPCAAQRQTMLKYRPQCMNPIPPLNPPNDYIFTDHQLLCDELINIDMISVERRIHNLWMHSDEEVSLHGGDDGTMVNPAEWLADIDDAWEHIEALATAVRHAAMEEEEPDAPSTSAVDETASSVPPTVTSSSSSASSTHALELDEHSAKMHDVMKRALTTQLLLNDASLLIKYCTSEGGARVLLDEHIDMRPSRVNKLVESNPMIAVEVYLLVCATKSSEEITSYFSALLSMDLSVHSMEVINRLTTLVEMPAEFLKLYARRCIQACRTIGANNSSYQKRIVRMVCVFLSSLIRHELIDNMDELNIEMRTFCLEFSAIKEAQALYQTITVKSAGKQDQN